MSDFVEQCRLEWKRLGVSDPLADEMAADLASDLSEAEADGVSVEELLGRSAFDPPSFAAKWATERGLIPRPPNRGTARHTPVSLVAFTATAAVALILAATLLLTGQPKLTLHTHLAGQPHGVVPLPPGVNGQIHSASAAAPVEWIFLILALIALAFAARLWANWSRSQPPIAQA
jgi:hypothetical protein